MLHRGAQIRVWNESVNTHVGIHLQKAVWSFTRKPVRTHQHILKCKLPSLTVTHLLMKTMPSCVVTPIR